MSDADQEELMRAWQDGRISIGVDRAYARDLYLWYPIGEIERLTGESPCFEKLIVWFAFLGTITAMLASIFLLVKAVGWWTLVFLPVTLLWWVLNFSLSVRGDSRIVLLSVILVAAAVVHFSQVFHQPWLTGHAAVFILALWLGRFLYCSSTDFLRAFVIRNKLALAAFSDGIQIRRVN